MREFNFLLKDSFHLFTLSINLFVFVDNSSLLRSFYSELQSSKLCIDAKEIKLSACRRFLFGKIVTLLLMTIKNNSGPRFKPCGTPDVTIAGVDLKLL